MIIAYGDASQKTQFAMINAFPAAQLDDPRLHWHWQTEMVMPDDESVLKLFEIQDSTLALRDEVKYGITYNKTAENQSSDSILYVLKREAYERFQYTFDRPEFSKMGFITWEEWEDVPYIEGGNVWREVDLKRYELKDHLGNVRVIVSDLRHCKLTAGVPTDFTALIKHYSNYYPFGMEKPAMVWDKGSYRYGYQGQEVDNEMLGTSNAISYKYRVEDARLGRFFSIDPLSAKYPWNSPYAFSENRVIDGVELEGLENIHYMVKWDKIGDEYFGGDIMVINYGNDKSKTPNESNGVKITIYVNHERVQQYTIKTLFPIMGLSVSPDDKRWKGNGEKFGWSETTTSTDGIAFYSQTGQNGGEKAGYSNIKLVDIDPILDAISASKSASQPANISKNVANFLEKAMDEGNFEFLKFAKGIGDWNTFIDEAARFAKALNRFTEESESSSVKDSIFICEGCHKAKLKSSNERFDSIPEKYKKLPNTTVPVEKYHK